MPAPTIAKLYDIEGRLEYAIGAVLGTGLTFSPVPSIYLSQSSVTASTPRVEVRTINVTRASVHMGPMGALDHWNWEVEIDVVTDRTVTGQIHGDYRGMVRYLMSKEKGALVSPVLTYFTLLDFEEAGASVDVESDEREDRTIMRYRGALGMVPAAFPGFLP